MNVLGKLIRVSWKAWEMLHTSVTPCETVLFLHPVYPNSASLVTLDKHLATSSRKQKSNPKCFLHDERFFLADQLFAGAK